VSTGLIVVFSLLLSAAGIFSWWASRWARRLGEHERRLDWHAAAMRHLAPERESEPVRLSPEPARTDLTDRECCKLIGGTLGCLMQMADPDSVRRALQWWAENEQAWGMIVATGAEIRRLTGVPSFRPPAESTAGSTDAPRAGHER
jgi:hypothetical protein